MIYFIQNMATKDIKIGHTKDLDQRFSSMKTANLNLKVLAVAEGDPEAEAALHYRFRESRIDPRREWFYLTIDLASFILDLVEHTTLHRILIEAKPQIVEKVIEKVKKVKPEPEGKTFQEIKAKDLPEVEGNTVQEKMEDLHQKMIKEEIDPDSAAPVEIIKHLGLTGNGRDYRRWQSVKAANGVA